MGMIIGVTGHLSSGKDTVANYLQQELGFLHISLSDILREDLKRRKIPLTRENLQDEGNYIREKYGGGILAERALGKRLPGKNYVITSIGRVDEINVLKKHPEFKLIFVTAHAKKRFEWMKKRNREQDPQTYKEFLKHEKKESKGGGAKFRELDNCMKASNIIVKNSGTINELNKKVNKLIKDIDLRPDWDEYFFGIMDAVSRRATCDRGKAASIIVKDKMILATGYVGAPAGLKHCDEVGHLMEKTKHTDGVERWHCVRTTHAEQNAIAQAAKHGISIKDSTIYVGMEPCLSCAKMIINSGIKKVVCKRRYHAANESRIFLKEAGIKLIVKEKKVESYKNMNA